MTARTWQRVAVAALAVAVLGGFLPLWPDGVRISALVLASVLTVAAVVLRFRWRRSTTSADGGPHQAHGGRYDGAARDGVEPHPHDLPRPDQRLTGWLGQ